MTEVMGSRGRPALSRRFAALRAQTLATIVTLLLCTGLVPLAPTRQALAQILSPATPTTVAPAAPPASSQPVTADELDGLVRTLQDGDARAKLIEQLRALVAAQRGINEAAAKEPDAATLLGNISRQIDATSGEILAGVAMVVDAPRLFAWAQRQVSDTTARERWIEVGLKLGTVFAFGFVAEWAIRRLLPGRRWWRPRSRGRTVETLSDPEAVSDLTPIETPLAKAYAEHRLQRVGHRLARLIGLVLSLLFDLLPIVAFAIVAYAILPLIFDGYSSARRTLLILVHATVTARALLCIAQAVLVPADPDASLVPANEETRTYLNIWAKRLICVAVFGYALPEAAWWLGIPGGVYALLLKTVGLVLAILTVIFVLQNRATISGWIEGRKAIQPGARGAGWLTVRRRLSETWHILAVTYIVAIYLIYALRVQGGFGFILRATALSLVIIVAARVLVRLMQRISRRGFAVAPDLLARFPGLEQRANRYVPILTGVASLVIYVVAGLTLLQAWDVASFSWFGSTLGRRMTGMFLSVGAVLLMALILWEVCSSAIERYLAGTDPSGTPRSARVRTLLPLLRTTLLCVIVIITALIVLSEIGVDIAPLLAGAGVVGIAVGFGSQALVKDVITGLFILVEDQFAVGDIVEVGKEHVGTVEAITIRTIRLRDVAGTVHTIPFSEVKTVKNLTRDFANVVARIGISYSEDIDRAVAVLRGVTEELMADPALSPFILDPFDYLGVDKLDEFAVVLLLRIRTVAKKQFIVGRAFNRLVKIAFEKHGIVTRDPSPVQFSAAGSGVAIPGGPVPEEVPAEQAGAAQTGAAALRTA